MNKTTIRRTVHDEVNGDEYEATFTFTNENGALNLTYVTIAGDNIQSATMRNIPFTQVILDVRSELKPIGKANVSELTDKRWSSSDAQCQAVATLYRHAMTLGLPVQSYIAEAVGRPLPTVTKWVMTARKRGYLGRADGSRKGEA